MQSIKNSWKYFFVLLMVTILNGCGGGGGNDSNNSPTVVPEGAIWTKQAIRVDTAPDGFEAFLLWAQTATLKGGQSGSEKAFVTIDYWKAIENINSVQNVLYEEHYDYNVRQEFTTGWAGLYVRYPMWFDLASNDYHAQAFNMYAQNSVLSIDVSQTPDNIVHWWTPRLSVKAGAQYSVEIRLKVEGKCSVQLGSDFYRYLDSRNDSPNGNNGREAWISDWIGDTNGQYVTVTAPIR